MVKTEMRGKKMLSHFKKIKEVLIHWGDGRKRKPEDSWKLDQTQCAFAQKLYTSEQNKVKNEVQQELTEDNYNVKDWYP